MELEDLVGTHMLDGVDYGIVDDMANSGYDFTNVIRFRLDGIVYTATEDPDDGYRSHMRKLIVNKSSAIKNSFEPIQVIAEMSDCGNILLVTDTLTGEVVLEVGTDYSDDYYPSFVSNFNPEAMCINKSQYFKRGYPDYSREALVKFVNKYLTDDILVVGPDGPEIDLLRLYCPNRLDGFEYSRFYPLPKKYVPAFNALLGETSIAEEETAALFYQLVAFDRNADTLTTCYRRYFTDYDGDFCNRRTAAKKGSRALAELGLLVPYNEWDTDCISSKSVFTWLVSAIDYNNPKRLFNWPQCDSAALAACCEEHPRIKQYMQAHTRDVDGWPITDSPLADLAKAIFLKDGDELIIV